MSSAAGLASLTSWFETQKVLEKEEKINPGEREKRRFPQTEDGCTQFHRPTESGDPTVIRTMYTQIRPDIEGYAHLTPSPMSKTP